jgi:hypothetical protein
MLSPLMSLREALSSIVMAMMLVGQERFFMRERERLEWLS